MPIQPAPQPRVNICIAVWNGASYLPSCLEALKGQTYANFDVTIWDNASTDETRSLVEQLLPTARCISHPENLGMWPAMERMINQADGTLILCLSVDVIIADTFIQEAVAVFERDKSVSALQPKIYQYGILDSRGALPTTTIDTCGFALTKSRRVVNLGHGQPDSATWSKAGDIFGVEGAAPMFRLSALQDARIGESLIDDDYFWYGDDLDLAWRLALLGHRQVFAPSVLAWHDRSTTKGVASTWTDHVSRMATRRAIPAMKRRLDYTNVRYTIIKNDHIINLILDAPWIIGREIGTILYMLIVEPSVLPAIARLIRGAPTMLAKRWAVMKRARRSWHQMRSRMFLRSPSSHSL